VRLSDDSVLPPGRAWDKRRIIRAVLLFYLNPVLLAVSIAALVGSYRWKRPPGRDG